MTDYNKVTKQTVSKVSKHESAKRTKLVIKQFTINLNDH
jgi:hypothetical protein